MMKLSNKISKIRNNNIDTQSKLGQLKYKKKTSYHKRVNIPRKKSSKPKKNNKYTNKKRIMRGACLITTFYVSEEVIKELKKFFFDDLEIEMNGDSGNPPPTPPGNGMKILKEFTKEKLYNIIIKMIENSKKDTDKTTLENIKKKIIDKETKKIKVGIDQNNNINIIAQDPIINTIVIQQQDPDSVLTRDLDGGLKKINKYYKNLSTI